MQRGKRIRKTNELAGTTCAKGSHRKPESGSAWEGPEGER